MAPDLTNLHAFGSVAGAALCLGGGYFLMALGLWNMAASGAAEETRARVTRNPAIIARRPVVILGERLFYRRCEVSGPASPVSFESPGPAKAAVKRPHREHFLAQKIA